MMELHNRYHIFESTISGKAKIIGKGNIRIGAFTVIGDHVLLDTGLVANSHMAIGIRCKIKQGAILRTYNGTITIGNRVSIGEYSIIAGHGGVTIGDCTLIAGQCCISAANHIFSNDEIVRFQGETAKGIYIGRNVWIGAGAIVLDGVAIEDGVVIGAGSVVSHNLPSYTICYGAPCRVIEERGPFNVVEDMTEESK